MVVGFIKPLEGMRALAILAVLLFHLDLHFLEGGYLGVDIFFVISGFIITKNLVTEMGEGHFKFSEFYYKRFRRLFPALMTTVLITVLVAFFLLPPTNLTALGKSGIWSIFSLANVNFWLEAGYFDAAADRKALLHMWSLGVEEQFYLFWPALLFLFRPKLLKSGMIVVLFVASLAGAYLAYKAMPNGVFFLFPFRVYQFLIGAFLAVIPLQMRFGGSIFSALGVALFTAACVLMPASEFGTPVTGSVAAVAGLLMLISYKSWFAEKFLGNPVFLWFGKRSYSIYLVHWPLVVLYKYATGFELDYIEMGALFVGSLVLGDLLNRLVEQPFRFRRSNEETRGQTANIFTLSVLGAGIFASANFWGYAGFPGRIEERISAVIEKNQTLTEDRFEAVRDKVCHARRNYEQTFNADECIKHNRKRPNVLVMGDSLAADAYMVLTESFERKAVVSQATQASCTPIYPPLDQPDFPQCAEFNNLRFGEFVPQKWDMVVLAGLWGQEDVAPLGPTIDYLKQYTDHVIVFGPRPRFSMDPVVKLEEISALKDLEPTLNKDVNLPTDRGEDIRAVVEAHGGEYIDLLALVCPENTCKVMLGEDLIYKDGVHWSIKGAKYYADALGPQLRGYIGLPATLD